MTGKKHFRHLERSYLLLLCGIGYNVIKWSHCELKRDLFYFLNICNDIISQHINANPMEQCFNALLLRFATLIYFHTYCEIFE